jgi:hypothetical protein
MNYPGMYLKIKQQSPGEERLDNFFWPADCINAPPEYFGESIVLLKTVKQREAEIITRVRGYLEYAEDATSGMKLTSSTRWKRQLPEQ